MAKDRAGAHAGAVALFHALREHAFHQIEILAHQALRFRAIRSSSLASNERAIKRAEECPTMRVPDPMQHAVVHRSRDLNELMRLERSRVSAHHHSARKTRVD